MAQPLRLYDNYTRSLREFTPLAPGAPVGIYTCGPTVYDYQHIGNFRTFMFEDWLKRVLAWNGYALRHVMNITDVGHLTSDADTGEDKMEKGSRRTGQTAWDIAALYTQRLSLAEVLNLLRVQVDYEARVGAWQQMMNGAMSKVQLAELMPTPSAARTQAYLALAGRKVGRQDWSDWLRRRVELLADPLKLVVERPLLAELWSPPAAQPIQE